MNLRSSWDVDCWLSKTCRQCLATLRWRNSIVEVFTPAYGVKATVSQWRKFNILISTKSKQNWGSSCLWNSKTSTLFHMIPFSSPTSAIGIESIRHSSKDGVWEVLNPQWLQSPHQSGEMNTCASGRTSPGESRSPRTGSASGTTRAVSQGNGLSWVRQHASLPRDTTTVQHNTSCFVFLGNNWILCTSFVATHTA